jgi:hypothetical protein
MKHALAILLFSTVPAIAETRIFIAKPLGQCLLGGSVCGLNAARAFCQSKDFVRPVSYRTINPEEYDQVYDRDTWVEIKCERFNVLEAKNQ